MSNNPRLKFIILAIIIFVVGIASYATMHIVRSNTYSAHVSLSVAPLSSIVTVNGNVVKGTLLAVKPGKVTVVVSKSGFATQSQTVTTSKGKTSDITVALISNSPSTANWYLNHPADQQELEVITGKNYNAAVQQSIQRLPLVASLPFIDLYYRVDYGQSVAHPNDPNAVAIYITYYSQDGKQQALDWLKFKGYDPATLEIIYTDKTGITP